MRLGLVRIQSDSYIISSRGPSFANPASNVKSLPCGLTYQRPALPPATTTCPSQLPHGTFASLIDRPCAAPLTRPLPYLPRLKSKRSRDGSSKRASHHAHGARPGFYRWHACQSRLQSTHACTFPSSPSPSSLNPFPRRTLWFISPPDTQPTITN